jgi:hypothetical protein
VLHSLYVMCPLLLVWLCVLWFECGALFWVTCIFVFCLIVVPLPLGKNPSAVQLNNNNDDDDDNF